MNQLQCIIIAAISFMFVVLASAQRAPTITLSPVQGTAYLYPNGIDYHEPSGSLLLSENYPYGKPYNFDRILFDGTHVQFSNVSGLPSEIYFATVRSSYTYSLAQGFQIGDTFTRTKTSGQIMRIQSDSTGQNVIVTDPWTTLPPPPSGSFSQLWGFGFDYTGVWGGDLLVVDYAGPIYRVNATGHATFLANARTLRPQTCCEGVGVIPNDPSRYGPYAGSIVTFDCVGTDVFILPPGQPLRVWTGGRSGLAWENLLYIFPYSNFWVVDSQRGALLASSWEDWESVVGEVMIYEEEPPQGTTGLYLLRYNSSIQDLYIDEIKLTSSSPTPLLLEGATFSAAGINNIAPAVNVCFVGFWDGQVHDVKPYKLPPGQTTPVGFYGYNTNARWSPDPHTSTPNVPRPQNDRIVFYWSLTQYNTLYLTILVDAPSDGTEGSLQLEISSVNLNNNSITLIQLDDSPQFSSSSPVDYADTYYWYPSNGNGLFQWRWGPQTSDGIVMGPFPLYQTKFLDRGYCIKPRIILSNGLSATPIYLATVTTSGGTQTTTYLPVGSDSRFCVYMCSQYCFMYESCIECNRNASQCIWCSATQQCLNVGQSTCPGNQTTSTCPCNTYTSQGCTACTSNPQCEWCCNNNIGSCVDAGANQCVGGTVYSDPAACTPSTQCNPQCTNGGQCICSKCQCPTGFRGIDCSETKDCLGVVNGTATYDICGVCAGNGTECLGCDGKPYGINFYDACGECGGNGLACFRPCNHTNCTDCVANSEICAWCPVEGKCIYIRSNETCQYANESLYGVTECPVVTVLTPEAIAGISAGVIAAIVIAIVVVLAATAGIGGRMIYVHFRKTDTPQDVVQNNPIYETKTSRGFNPLYETKTKDPPQ